MNNYILDTNVLIVANKGTENVSIHDTKECQDLLMSIHREGKSLVFMDDNNEIFSEYFKHCSHSGQPGIGDFFVKWLFENQWQNNFCKRIAIHKVNESDRVYSEFPEESNLAGFDKSDQKFVAVCVAAGKVPVICNACDSDWFDFKNQFESNGIHIQFVCHEQLKKWEVDRSCM